MEWPFDPHLTLEPAQNRLDETEKIDQSIQSRETVPLEVLPLTNTHPISKFGSLASALLLG